MKNHIADLISEYEKLMDAEKNAYDWQNTVAEKTKQIADLRKQLLAYSGDMSEESRAKIQSLTVSLKDSEKDLRESQYEKFISDSKDMLSDLQDNFDDVIQDVIDSLSEHFDKLYLLLNLEKVLEKQCYINSFIYHSYTLYKCHSLYRVFK